MRKKLLPIIVLLVAFCQMQTFAQTSRVTGKVIGSDNNPVAGASVTISGTTQGTVTDADGNFAITAPSDASLLINSIGFVDQVIKIDGRTSLNVTLATGQSAGLEEVVVTGYTAQRKKDIVGSVAVVDVKALKAVPTGSALQALQGQASGVNITNSGVPGGNSNILVRGVNGFATAPLVLIDGVQGGSLNDVPAQDVESIQILKDAGSASIYGARGANGVIIITTKRGKSGQPRVSYENYFNYQMPRSSDKLDLLTADEYLSIYQQINPSSQLFINGQLADYFYRSGLSGPRGVGNEGDAAVAAGLYKFDPMDVNNNYIIEKTQKTGRVDMYDAIFDPALMMNHNITASGGTDRATYLFSLGYMNHQGVMKNSFLKRYHARINSTYKLNSWIRIGENINVFYKNNQQFSANGAFGPVVQAINHLPFMPIKDIGGNYGGPFAGPGINDLGDWGNALADVELTDNNRNRNYQVVGNAYLEVDILKNLTAKTSFGGAFSNWYNQLFKYSPYWTSGGGNNTHSLTDAAGFSSQWQWTNTLNYNALFGQHRLNVLAGTEAYETQFRQVGAIGQGYFSTNYNFLVVDRALNRLPPTNELNGQKPTSTSLFSLFGKVDYSFADKYLVSVTVRRDGYSAFGPDAKYGVFPAVGLGWRLSEEAFMDNVSWINDLKIRGSYGVMGNKEPVPLENAYNTFGQNPQKSYYDISGTGNAIRQGFYAQRYGNTFTSWEEDKVTNIGLDATLFNNKLDFSIEWYKKAMNGLLRQIQLPGTAGEGISPVVNVGDVQNKGVDISANYRDRISKDVSFSVGVNFTAYKNKIIKLPEPGYFDDGLVRFEEGYPMFSFYGFKVLGVFRDQKEVDESPVQQDKEPGRYKYFDADGNDTINDKDRVHYGDANPDFTMGVNLGLNWKNFDFSAQIYTVQGIDLYNNTYEYIGGFDRGIGNKSRILLNAWTPENQVTNVKKNETGRNFSNSSVNNSRWMEDGSFVRLRSIMVGYTIPNSSLRRVGLSNLRVFVQGTNLVTLTKYSGLDPEVVSNGVDAGAYVPIAGINFGLNLTF